MIIYSHQNTFKNATNIFYQIHVLNSTHVSLYLLITIYHLPPFNILIPPYIIYPFSISSIPGAPAIAFTINNLFFILYYL